MSAVLTGGCECGANPAPLLCRADHGRSLSLWLLPEGERHGEVTELRSEHPAGWQGPSYCRPRRASTRLRASPLSRSLT
jgi:hypothetical protein